MSNNNPEPNMDFKREHLVSAKDQFASASRSLVMAVRALQMSGGNFAATIKEVKETIGDLTITVEQINDHLDNTRGLHTAD